MASNDAHNTLGGTNRSSVVGDDKGTVFIVDFDNKKGKKLQVPERLQNYNSKRKTAEEIANNQQLAEERKKKHDENKARQARKVSEEAVRYDQMVQAKLESNRGKWYSNALK